MHVMIPKAFGWDPNSSMYDAGPSDVPRRRHCAWLAKRDDMETTFLKMSFFKEHRRKNYSDVCHSKLSASTCPLDGAGLWELIPKGRPDKPGSTTLWRLSGQWDSVEKHGRGGGYIGNGATAVFGAGNGQVYYHCSICVDQTYGPHGGEFSPYVRVEFEVWRRLASQPKANEIRFVSSSGVIYWKYHPWEPRKISNKVTGVFASDPTFKSFASLWENQVIPPGTDARSQIVSAMRTSFDSYLRSWLLDHAGDAQSSSYAKWSYPAYAEGEPLVPILREEDFLLHEPGVIMDGTDDMLYGTGFEHYWREVAKQHAYLDALQHVPKMSDNMISNILEISSFIKSLVVDHRVKIPDSLSDLWLAYRYSYGTTKMDADEAIRFVHRHMDLGKWTHLKTYGSYSFTFKETRILCRCELEVYPKALKTVQKVWSSLYTYGLSPSFYMVWDMIPYSFIVDWFLPIGDVMAAWDAEREYKHAYDLKDVNFSLEYERQVGGFPVHFYTRWYSSTPEPLRGYYFLEDDPSTKTIVKRIIDAGALILG